MTSIYLLRLENALAPLEFNRLLHQLSEEGKNRILRIKKPYKASQSLLSELIVRQRIIIETGLKNHEICINRDSLGKPYAEDLPDFHFNCSHSKEWIACATGPHPLGIDIQQIRDFSPHLPQRYFSPKELDYIMSTSPELQQERVFDLWSLKEAYLKMLGIGIRVPLNSFSILLNTDPIFIEAADLDTNCHLYKLDCIDGYKLSLCTRLHALEYSYSVLQLEDLIKFF